MYTVRVFNPGSEQPCGIYTAKHSDELMKRIPKILAAHEGCQRIVVYGFDVQLFSVDCKGNRLLE